MINHERRIATALSTLFENCGQAFVVIRLESTGQFLQVMAVSQEELLLDLPVQLLSDDERSLAHSVFEGVGAFVSEEQAFQAHITSGPEAVAALVIRVLREVFRVPRDGERLHEDDLAIEELSR